MRSEAGIWYIAADMIAHHGSVAEDEAVRQANLMLENDDREGQIEWLRIWTAIVLIRGQPKQAGTAASGAFTPAEVTSLWNVDKTSPAPIAGTARDRD